jgi:hypothetical protein
MKKEAEELLEELREEATSSSNSRIRNTSL